LAALLTTWKPVELSTVCFDSMAYFDPMDIDEPPDAALIASEAMDIDLPTADLAIASGAMDVGRPSELNGKVSLPRKPSWSPSPFPHRLDGLSLGQVKRQKRPKSFCTTGAATSNFN
jgi:hypothetical protein